MSKVDLKIAIEQNIIKELLYINKNGPVHPGDTISHGTAEECVNRKWAARDENGDFVIADKGKERLGTNGDSNV